MNIEEILKELDKKFPALGECPEVKEQIAWEGKEWLEYGRLCNHDDYCFCESRKNYLKNFLRSSLTQLQEQTRRQTAEEIIKEIKKYYFETAYPSFAEVQKQLKAKFLGEPNGK